MGLVDRILVPTKMMPLEPWELELLGRQKTFELWSHDLAQANITYVHTPDGQLMSIDGDKPKIMKGYGNLLACDDGGHQTEHFATAPSEALFGFFELIYDSESRLQQIIRRPDIS